MLYYSSQFFKPHYIKLLPEFISSYMGSFKNLLQASDDLVVSRAPPKSSPDVTDVLVPLAALAVQSAHAIPGLSECLEDHGWNGSTFANPLDLERFNKALWQIYHCLDKSKLAVADNALGIEMLKHMNVAIRWDSQRPLQSFRDQLRVLEENSRYIPTGAMLSSLDYYTGVAIIEMSKLGQDAELFKRKLQTYNWNIDKYCFDKLPDLKLFADAI